MGHIEESCSRWQDLQVGSLDESPAAVASNHPAPHLRALKLLVAGAIIPRL